MIKGLRGIIRPFCRKILIEDYFSDKVTNKSQVDVYYEKKVNTSQNLPYVMSLTMDFSIKTEIDYSLDPLSNNSSNLKGILNAMYLNVIPIFSNISSVLTQENFQMQALESLIDHYQGTLKPYISRKIFENNQEITDYIEVTDPSPLNNYQQKIFNLPIQIQAILDGAKYGINLNLDNKNPNFLGYVFFLSIGPGKLKNILSNTINTEIVFNQGQIQNKTGYFIVSKTFSYGGQDSELTKAPIPTNKTFIDTINDNVELPYINNLIDPDTGESLNPDIPTDRNQQVNYLFGAPGDVWTGPVHLRVINSTKARMMAGAKHDESLPHPYLDFVVKNNTKIVDFRSIGAFEDLFSYKSSTFEKILAESQSVIFTGQKRNKTIKEIIKENSIFSEGKFSIRPVLLKTSRGEERTKDKINFFFALDKSALLKHTTKAPLLLEALTRTDGQFYQNLTDNIDIFHFEIIRYNKQTKESKTLIVGDNDLYFDDSGQQNYIGKNLSKGFYLRNRTSDIVTQNSSAFSRINFYEFTDGEIDAYRDTNTYSYEIVLKFRDPLIQFLSNHLRNVRLILKDLDELLHKTTFMIKDPNEGKFVQVYDRFKKQLNSTFVSQSLNPPVAGAALPLNFSFEKTSEIPSSIYDVTIGTLGSNLQSQIMNNLLHYYLSIQIYGKEQLQGENVISKGYETTELLNQYIINSLRLSTTTPTLIEKVRSLMDLIRDKTEKLLSLYSTEKLVKKSSSFTTKDYIKSTGNTKVTETYVTEINYKFDNKIDLSKTKDNFNWIEEAKHIGEAGSIKSISKQSYKSLVKNPNIVSNLIGAGQENYTDEALFSYSFLPYVAPSTLELQKTQKIDIVTNNLQVIRKKLIHNITDTPQSVLIPEILATYGIKFNLSDKSVLNYINDINAYEEGKIPINNPLEDNFGSDFTPQPKPISEYEGYGFSTMKAPAFGSVEDPDYAWQGGGFGSYPYNFALSLINLLNTNVYQRRSINYLKQEHKKYQPMLEQSIFNTKSIPYAINLFSTNTMSDPTEQSEIFPLGSSIFNNSGEILFNNYAYYSYLLNVFGQVYYLKGFKFRGTKEQTTMFENEYSFSPTSILNRSFIKDMDWQPLDLNIINNIPTGKRLLCKVVFFEAHERAGLLDKKVIDMYRHFYNYNQLFYISYRSELITPVTSVDRVEIATNSPAKETRDALNSILTRTIEEATERIEKESMASNQERITTEAMNEAIKNSRGISNLDITKPRRN